jgi:hypothetical protein
MYKSASLMSISHPSGVRVYARKLSVRASPAGLVMFPT